jgi:hypothetical protein
MNHALMCAAMLAMCASGCAAPGGPKVLASTSLAQCPLATPHQPAQLDVLDDGVQWAGKLRGTPEAVLQRPVRWADERVVLYSLGQQPNPGYGVALTSKEPGLRGSTLSLPVQLVRPAPDQMMPMAIAWPCLLVVLPRVGWDTVQVVDAQGKVLAEPVSAR